MDKVSHCSQVERGYHSTAQNEGPGTVEIYVFGVRKFVQFLGLTDLGAALESFRNGGLDATVQVDKFIEHSLKAHAHKTVLSRVHGVKKWLEYSIVDHIRADLESATGEEMVGWFGLAPMFKTVLNDKRFG